MFACRCNEEDHFIMGALVSEVIREVECSIPEYQEEIFTGELCEYPEQIVANERNLLVADTSHRGLADYIYSYRGGGFCRRCRRSRRLQARQLQEMTREAVCHYADNAKIGTHVAETTLDDANNSYEEVMELALNFFDIKKGYEMAKKADKEMIEVGEHVIEAQAEYELSQGFCDSIMPESSKDMEKVLNEAKKASQKSLDETIKATEKLHELRGVKVDILTKEVQRAHEKKKEQLEKLVFEMRKDLEEKIEDIEKEIADKKNKIEKEDNIEKRAEYEQELTQMLEVRLSMCFTMLICIATNITSVLARFAGKG